MESRLCKRIIQREKELERAAEHIKDETQELHKDTDSHSDPQIRQTAEFVQKMSEEILEQKERLSDKKASVKDTCREVKIFLHQITNLAGDKLQSLSEEAKLKLDSLIKSFWKMRASMWKLIFCVLLLHELRDVFDILKSESCFISLSRGRLKYAFKMASMLALWLSRDVETNPGPHFNERTCVEMYVRRLSLALRDDLDTDGRIWSKQIAEEAYNAGFSRNLRWTNPSSGKKKDSLHKLKERAKELIRLLSARNCLPSDLPAFTDLDQQETLDGLRKYLEVKHFETAANVLLNEPDITTSLKEKIRLSIQLALEEISNSNRMIHNPPARPLSVSNVNEFQQLADPQCLNDSEGEGTTLRQNESSTDCPVSPSPLSTSMDTQRHEGDNRGLTNRVCTQSATTDTLQDEARRVEGSTGSGFACRTSDDNQENIMAATPCTPETDVSPSHEEQRDVNIVWPSDSDSFDRADDVEASHPNTDASVNVNTPLINTRDITVPADTSDEALLADIKQFLLINTRDITVPADTSDEALPADIKPLLPLYVGDAPTSPTVTFDVTDDVSRPTSTSDQDILPDLESGPSRVLNVDDVNTSHRHAPNADYSPCDETQSAVPAACAGGCEGDSTNASEPLLKVSPDNNQVDTVCEGVYETFGMEACEATPETDTNTSETTETDTHACVTTVETDTQDCVTRETDAHAGVTTAAETQTCVTTAEISTQTFLETAETRTQTCVTTAEGDTQTYIATTDTDTQTCVVTAEGDTQTYIATTDTDTQTCVVTAEGDTQTHVTTAEGDTQTYIATIETDTQTCATKAGTGQTPRSLGNSLNQVDSDESEMSPGRSCGTSRKRKQQLQHLPSKKRRI
ncbi:mucin-5AC-like [Haliotis rubra]|uniref:mucin-5AC-like n=1 Tax=Haliotis rubra TaxID=36100 RepID=UPI001EE52C5A|nr:mucin-5AC-like [Haliotis rubra]